MVSENTPTLTVEYLARIIDPPAWLVCDERGEPSYYLNSDRPWYIQSRDESLAVARKMLADFLQANMPEAPLPN